ncbi:MAG: hypothetical protein RMK30_09470 [Anaerolineae bacterium]|nr:hypothetical protein [Anaerolineae bacterium]MDW8103093.1 hypothetical protein [Anaerolineae bacterium]
MRELLIFLAPFGAAAVIYLLPQRRFSFWLASGASLAMAFLDSGEFSWIWGTFAFAFLLGWFVEAPPLTSFWAMLSLGLARGSFLFPQSPFEALILSSSLLLILPALWTGQSLDFSGISVFLLLALGPFLTSSLPGEWRAALVLASLMGAFPFHLWVRSAMRDGPSPGALLLVAGFRAIILLWLGKEEVEISWAVFQDILKWLGIISILWGGLQALMAKEWGEIGAYVATVEAGVMLLLAVKAGFEVSIVYSILAGLALLTFGAGSWGVKRFMEEGRTVTPAVFLLVAGLLATAGLPLTPGYPATALALNYLGGKEGLLILAGKFGIMAGGMRLLQPLAPALRPDPSLRSSRAVVLLITAILFFALNFAL